jgi:hypothetical protein
VHARRDAHYRVGYAQAAYLLMLTAELGNESTPSEIRRAAGIAIKNTLAARVRYSRSFHSVRVIDDRV